jgi:hypothetical protein
MNFVQIFSGRKRESPVWKYFKYIPEVNKSKCIIIDKKTLKECGNLTAGKNPTNLKSHLATAHENIAQELKQQNEKLKTVKRKRQEIGM